MQVQGFGGGGFLTGVTTRYAAGGRYEVDAATGATKKSYRFGGRQVAIRDSSTGLHYLHQDQLGSTSLQTSAAGAYEGHDFRGPFGQPWQSGGSLSTDFKYTDQRSFEGSLGSLYDYGSRFYSPVLGRFLSPDTIVPGAADPQHLNRYGYTGNNPLTYTDPTGHARACGDWDGVDCGGGGGGLSSWDGSFPTDPVVAVVGAAVVMTATVGAQAVEASGESVLSGWRDLERKVAEVRAQLAAKAADARSVLEGDQNTEQNKPRNRVYEDIDKHGDEPQQYARGVASRAPSNPQAVLNTAVPVSPDTTSRLVGHDPVADEFVVFDRHAFSEDTDFYHGHVRNWTGEDSLTQAMRNALQRARLVNSRGRPLTTSGGR